MTSTGPDNGHTVSYSFQGQSLLSFNSNGTGDIRNQGLAVTTSYAGHPLWAPINGLEDGTVTFRYTVNQDPTHRIRLAYEQTGGRMSTSVAGTGITGEPPHAPPVWLTDSYLTCGHGSITIRRPGDGRQDTYVLDK